LAPSDGSLLLGWHAHSARCIGFGSANAGSNRDEQRWWLYNGDGHLITLAPTGSGKGRGTIVSNLLRCPNPVTIFDAKGWTT
jgi:type IV secretion system protein VirD4